ncbi:Fur family transcriptional regulator [Nocardiopsis composta]|uniref:Fur family ferric uptake transcriptional regulator n=1 Tax=Nocardiopsis composta TaxID=157465 RepID=A0A7W8QKX1_9ACTN|nr:transcriptional repressor [Nocardiopsis composta]MBB5432124.1 Fur family ferric uptake transcriptional regulator [Nocardiopsis composta]
MSTRREAVKQALNHSTGFRSAQDLYADLRAEGSKIGLTTVYRALQNLHDSGEVDVLRTDDGEAVYRACASESHHHHLVCRGCGKAVEVEGPAVEKWAENIGAQHGFTGVTHTVEVFGTCAECAAARSAGPEGAAKRK